MFFLLGQVSVLGQEAGQLGVIRAGQYVAAIQGIFPDGVGEGRSGPVRRICACVLPDSVGQALAGAVLYVEVYLHTLRHRFVFGIILGVGDGVLGAFCVFLGISSAIGSGSASFSIRVMRCRASGQVSGNMPSWKNILKVMGLLTGMSNLRPKCY